MNDEPSTSTAAGPPIEENLQDHSNRSSEAARNGAARERRKRDRTLFNTKRASLLADLNAAIDLLVYAELAAIYYMDCSFLRFVMRAFVQFLFLTPKPAYLPEPPPDRPYIGALLGTNILCMVLHIYFAAPEAGEATRGYLHGGLAMDFIGQKGPTSKLHLVLLDLLVLALQLVNLAATLTRQKVRSRAPSSTGAAQIPTVVQDHDSEERGQLRSDHDPVDIELQSLNPDGRRAEQEADTTESEQTSEQDALLSSPPEPHRSTAHIFDAFNSGEIIVADLDIVNVVRDQLAIAYNPPPASSSDSPTTRSTESFSARLARGGLGVRFRIGDRILRV